MKYFGYIFRLVLLSIFLIPAVSGGEISPDLAEKIKSISPEQKISVLIVLKDGISSIQLSKRMATNYKSNAERHREGVALLKARAAQSQTDMMTALGALKSRGDAESIKSHWLINAIAADINVSEIESLSERQDVLEIALPPQVKTIAPVESGISAVYKQSADVDTNLAAVGADEAWAMGYDGEGSIVCSFDTGIDGNHPALYDNWKGHDGNTSAAWFDPMDGESFPHTFDEAGEFDFHGTHVMGIMVGRDDNTGDTVGVAPGAQWISAGVIDLPYVSILDAFEWAADPDGDPNTFDDVPDVINHSWGFENSIIGCDNYLWEMIDNTEALGIVNIFAAGNSGSSPMTIANPANRANDTLDCFAVGAFNHLTTSDSKILSSSSRGPSDCDEVSIKPNVVAPGVSVRSSVPGGAYESNSGTSMAAPHVAGAVAILRQYAPNATVDEIKEALLAGCIRYPDSESSPNNDYGWGLINIPAAIDYLTPEFDTDLRVHSYEGWQAYPGEISTGYVYIKNLGGAINNVSASVTGYDEALTVNTLNLNFGTIDIGEVVQSDIQFSAEVDDTVSAGRMLAVDLTLAGDGGYSKPARLYIRIGTEEPSGTVNFCTIDNDMIKFAISNFGQYGFGNGSFVPLGMDGFKYSGGNDHLFEAALLIGVDAEHVSDGARNFAYEPDNDFQVAGNGTMVISEPGDVADLETFSIYNDNQAEDPVGLRVEQSTYAWNSAPDNNYVIMEYAIENGSKSAVTGLYAGMFFDWDIITFYYNCGGWSAGENLGYMYYYSLDEVSLSYRGTSVINPEGAASYRLQINPDPPVTWQESDKYAAMTEGFLSTEINERNDLSYIISTGPFNLMPGESDTAVFAVMAAENLDDLKAAAVQAANKYQTATDVDVADFEILPEDFHLFQNYPNPFNPSTVIKFGLASRARVNLDVFNILGEKVNTLVDSRLAAGYHEVSWNGRDDSGRPVASGIYLYRLKIDGNSLVRKMVLLK